MEDRTGQWLAGRYRLDRRLATDTTGDRYEAWDGAALLQVVVHLLAPAMLESPDAVARYEEQAGRLRTFDHRGIVAMRGIEQEGATLFLVLDTPPGDAFAAIAGREGNEARETAAIRHGDTVANFPATDATCSAPLAASQFRSPDDGDQTGLFNAPTIPAADPDDGRRRPRAVSVLALFTVLVVASALILGTLVVKRDTALAAQQEDYATAEAALGYGAYDTAIAAFTAAGAYRDAPSRARAAQTEKEQQANYDTGMAAFGQGDYTAAADAFGKAGGLHDAPQRQVDAVRLADQQQAYADGQHALAQEDFPAAAAAFARAGDYQDATRQAAQAQSLIGQQRQYQTGMDALTHEDYATATAAFRAAGTYKDAPQQATQAEQSRVRKVAYDAGAAAFAREDFTTAKQQFMAAGDYKDAPARAAQADQENMLAAKYALAQIHLQASQWKDAYANLQDIKKIRPDYRDVSAVISHLENDVVNPTAVDTLTILNAINGYKEAWVPVNNLIGQPVTWLYIAARQTVSDARPDQISAVSLSLVAAQGAKEALNGEIPVLAANPGVPDKNMLRAGEKIFVATDKGQTFEIAEFGKYRARLTVTNLAFPLKIAGNDSAGPNTAFFSHMTVDVTLTPKTP